MPTIYPVTPLLLAPVGQVAVDSHNVIQLTMATLKALLRKEHLSCLDFYGLTPSLDLEIHLDQAT